MAAHPLPASRDGNGFSAEMTGADARRQLRLSLGVVVALAVCIVSAAVSVGGNPLAAKRDAVSTPPVVTMHAESHPIGARAI